MSSLRKALEKATDIASRPHRNGTVDLVITFPKHGDETELFRKLYAASDIEGER